MTVSAIVPNLDSGALLDRCLEALDAAAGVDEVIVADGGSRDGSDLRARTHRRVRVIERPGTGMIERVNAGVDAARGDSILLLNSDAFVEPDTVPRLAAALAQEPRLAVVGAHLVCEDGSVQKSGGEYRTFRSIMINTLSPHQSLIRRPIKVAEGGLERVPHHPLACALIRRSAWDGVGGMDPQFDYWYDDHDVCKRLSEAGWGIAVDWDARVVHIGGGSREASTSSRFRRYHRNRILYLRKHYPRRWWLYSLAWAPRASAHVATWWGRAWMRERRGDSDGARAARDWAAAFRQTILPRGGR